MSKSGSIINMESQVEFLERRYDPENDTILYAPRVTNTDSRMLDIITLLIDECADLRQRIEELS